MLIYPDLTKSFSLGDTRLVLIEPGELEGRAIESESKSRLKMLFSSLQRESYSIETARDKKIEKMDGKLDMKEELKELSKDLGQGFSKTSKEIKELIKNYQENRKERKEIKNSYNKFSKRRPLDDAVLYQGGDNLLEVGKTTDYLEDLLSKERKIYRAVEKEEGISNLIDSLLRRVNQWEREKYDLRVLRKQDYYKILVSSKISECLNKLTGFIGPKSLTSMGQRLKLPPGGSVLIDTKGFQKELEIKIPICRKEKLENQIIKITCRA